MIRQLTYLNFKMISSSLLAAREITWLEYENMLYPPAHAYSGPSQASQMGLFVGIVNVFKLTFITIFSKFYCRYLQDVVTPLICSNGGN